MTNDTDVEDLLVEIGHAVKNDPETLEMSAEDATNIAFTAAKTFVQYMMDHDVAFAMLSEAGPPQNYDEYRVVAPWGHQDFDSVNDAKLWISAMQAGQKLFGDVNVTLQKRSVIIYENGTELTGPWKEADEKERETTS